MRKLKKNARIKDVVRSAPKSTHKSGSGVAKTYPTHTHISKTKDVVRSTPKATHPKRILNLGAYAHAPAKLADKSKKIGTNVKTKKLKTNKPKKGY